MARSKRPKHARLRAAQSLHVITPGGMVTITALPKGKVSVDVLTRTARDACVSARASAPMLRDAVYLATRKEGA